MAEILSVAGGVIVGVFVLVVMFKPFFGDSGGFWEALRYMLTPDIISWFRGEYAEDWWAQMKMAIWLLAGGMAGFGVYKLILSLFASPAS